MFLHRCGFQLSIFAYMWNKLYIAKDLTTFIITRVVNCNFNLQYVTLKYVLG